MNLDRRVFLASAAAAAALPSRLLAEAAGRVLRPEDFGARGDGVTNDTRAFAALSAEINRQGGGTIALASKRTYVVGEQNRGGVYGWSPAPILELHDLTMPLTIIGNGAVLRCAPGLRYGTFDLAADQPSHHPLPYLKLADLASPYHAMVWIRNCRGPISVRDIELDGNVPTLRIGGKFGDTGWQVPATGLLLEGNLDAEAIENVFSHHHGQDGAMMIGDNRRTGRSLISRLVSQYNGRQGLSLTGGRGYDFADCEFSHTGRAGVRSAPGAGVDIEAEQPPIRDVTFARCKFIDNAGCGFLADSGDSEDVHLSDCLFVGTTAWSAWPRKPRFSFESCTFVGSVAHAFSDPDPDRACHFIQCRFTDDPRLSPTGQVYTPSGPIVNLATSDNVLFDRCTFDLVASGLLPWTWRAIYKDCTMSQRSPQTATPKGKFLGTTTISGPVDIYGSMVIDTLIVNGVRIAPGPKGVAPW